jgi:hypothetical protein
MGLRLRLGLLQLRQRVNFRLLRLLLVLLYMAITASVLIYHFHSPAAPLEELLVDSTVDGGAKGPPAAGFLLVGGQPLDFRRNGFQVGGGFLALAVGGGRPGMEHHRYRELPAQPTGPRGRMYPVCIAWWRPVLAPGRLIALSPGPRSAPPLLTGPPRLLSHSHLVSLETA